MRKQLTKYFKLRCILIVSIIVLIGSCKTGVISNNESYTMPVDFKVLLQGAHGNFTTQVNIVISNQEQLVHVFETINSTITPNYELPVINFSKDQAVLSSMGERTSGGHTITVDSIVKTSNIIKVRLNSTSPVPGEMSTTVMTSPFVIYVFEKQSLPIQFENN